MHTTEHHHVYFTSDYMEGAYPAILKRLSETNLMHTEGYGSDPFCLSAADRIRRACGTPQAEIAFLSGGTQTNSTCIDALLRTYEGVIAAETGHINGHEAGAVEFCGHKILTLPSTEGKLSPAQVRTYLEAYHADKDNAHIVVPGMLYLSQPTEFGTLYTRAELTEIYAICKKYEIALFIDGARLAYALASPKNDITLQDLAGLCDLFYIGGTKCGALCGEAVVIPDPARIPHFFTIRKQHGAVLAKGRLLGIQFDELFRDDLYLSIGKEADLLADEIAKALTSAGYQLHTEPQTNQIFIRIPKAQLPALSESVSYSFWTDLDETYSVIRLVTSWATTREDVEELIRIFQDLAKD